MEQLVLEQFSAEPPFGGSNIISYPLFNTPYLKINPGWPEAESVQWHSSSAAQGTGSGRLAAIFRPLLLYGQFQPHLRTQYSAQYNLNIQRNYPRIWYCKSDTWDRRAIVCLPAMT